MKEDFIVQDFNIPPHPKGVVLNGKTVRLEPLNVENHSEDLFESNSLDVEGEKLGIPSVWAIRYFKELSNLAWKKRHQNKTPLSFLLFENLMIKQ